MTKTQKLITGWLMLLAAAILIATGFGLVFGVSGVCISLGVTLVFYAIGFFAGADV